MPASFDHFTISLLALAKILHITTRFEQVRAISMSRYLEPARSWSQTGSKPNSVTLFGRRPVSYTHLTLPTIYSV